MALDYLKAAYKDLQIKPDLTSAIISTLYHSLHSIRVQIKNRYLPTASKPKKKPKAPTSQSPSNSSKYFSPKLYMSDFKKKAEENKYFALKLIKDQNARRNRQEAREERIRQKFLEEIHEQERMKEMIVNRKEKVKKDQILMIMERSKERKRNILMMKEIGEKEYKKAVSSTPLYKRIESEFLSNVEMPELEKRKEELRKKRELFRPFDYDQLKDHERKIDQMHLAQSNHRKYQMDSIFSRSKSLKKSKVLQRLLEEESLTAQEQLEKEIAKKNLIAKKKQYSSIVKEVFQPTLDMFKRKEMELIKARLNHPVVVKFNLTSEDDLPTDKTRSMSYTPKKFKKNPMIPEKPPKKKPVVKDYIEEFREARKRSLSYRNINKPMQIDIDESLPSEQKQKNLRQKVDFLDREARKQELKIGLVNSLNPKSINISEQVSALLVDSIRTKLAILDNTLS